MRKGQLKDKSYVIREISKKKTLLRLAKNANGA